MKQKLQLTSSSDWYNGLAGVVETEATCDVELGDDCEGLVGHTAAALVLLVANGAAADSLVVLCRNTQLTTVPVVCQAWVVRY